jgi:hypothetical protein
MMVFGQAATGGIDKLYEFGAIGVMLALAVYGLIIVWRQNTSNLVDWRVEARADLKEERLSRQAHEQAMTKLLGELVASIADIKEGMQILLEELKRLKESGK